MLSHKSNLCKRLFSLGLAAAFLTASALPAGAAGTALTKEETVYLVMNGDGSIQSTTVSDHLHSDAGLATVEDSSTLQDIENTQGTAEYTRQGDALIWNTDDTDVYYKGTTDQTPPVTAEIQYQLDGKTVAADALPGQSGHLVIRINLTNHETGTIETNGVTRQVCTPYAAVVGAVLNSSFTNVTAEHGLVQGDGGTQIAGFICLPGVRACLGDLLGEQFSGLTEYLLDSVTLEADVTELTMPSIMVACATDTSMLADVDGIAGLDKLDGLQEDMDALTDAMDQLLDGATRLSTGAAKLDTGAATLKAGVTKLDNGAATLNNGAAQLNDGAATLDDGAGRLADGTASLKEGATSLDDGAGTLKNGADSLYGGAQSLADGAAKLKSGADTLSGGLGQLSGGLATLSSGLSTLSANSAALNAGAQQIADAVLATANSQLKAQGAITEDMTWQNYADVLAGVLNISDEMRAAARNQISAQVGAAGVTLSDAELDTLLYLVATSGNSDLTAAVTTAAGQMAQASADAADTGAIGQAKQALAAAANQPAAVPAVATMLKAQAYAGICQQLAAAGADAAAQPVVVLLAARRVPGCTTTAEVNTALGEAAALLQMATPEAADAADIGAVAADLAADPNPLHYPEVTALLAAGPMGEAYGKVAAALGDVEDSTAALLITMASQATQTADGCDLAALPAALQAAGATATNAATVSGVLATVGNPGSEGYTSYQQTIQLFLTNLVKAQQGGALDAVSNLSTQLAGVQTFIASLRQYTGGVDTAAAGAASANTVTAQLAAGAVTLDEGLATLNGGANTLQSGAAQLAGGATSLKEGTGTLKEGTATLQSGAADLKGGTATLKDGTDTLRSGASALKTGTGDLKTGAADLKKGTAELNTGAKTLADGLNQFNEEGIEKLLSALDTDQLAELKDVATAMKDRQQQATSFTGAPENAQVSTRFVLKTAEQTKAAAPDTATAASTKTTLWQRILALFGLNKK
ncbi:MAG: hypothetical protein PHO10_07045 [Gemmiger sp.]|nr:hypothetical protein [Gemmiger sp.]